MSEEVVKLGNAAMKLLKRLEHESQLVRPRTKSVLELREAGFVEFDDQAGNGFWWLVITPAGRKALKAAEGIEP